MKSDEPVERTLDGVLSDRRFAFCHDADHVPGGDASLCRFADKASKSCPAFAKACGTLQPNEDYEPSFDIPLGFGPLATILFWTLIALLAGWCISKIVANFKGLSAPDGDVDPAKAGLAGGSTPSRPPSRVLEKDSARLLEAARQALAMRDGKAAVLLSHAALVRALESAGHVHVERSTTNGDYVRELRAKPELRDVLRATSREVERSEFGDEPPPLARIEGLFERVKPIVERLLVASALALFLLGAGCSPELRGSREDAPSGTAVLRELFVRRGASFERRTEPLSRIVAGEVDLVIVTPSADLSDEDWAALRLFVQGGGGLMLAGAHPDVPEDFGIEQMAGEACSDDPRVLLPDLAGTTLHGLDRPLHLDSKWIAAASCGKGPLIASRRFGIGKLFVLSDFDFMTNASLSRQDHAKILFALLGSPNSVTLADWLISAGASNPYTALANSRLTPTLAQGLGWLLLWALATGIGFGARRDPADPPRRAFSEHVRALGQIYARAGATRHALGVYSRWAVDRLSGRLRPGGRMRMLDLSQAVAAAVKRPEGTVARILTEAFDAREHPDGPNSPAEDLATLAALDEIVNEAGGYR